MSNSRFFFGLLQWLVVASSLAGIAVLTLIVALSNFAQFVKDFLGTIGSVIVMFASGFQKSSQGGPSPFFISVPQVALALLLVAFMVSAFMPRHRALLHAVAGASVVLGGWCVWAFVVNSRVEILLVPFIVFWLIYYAVCVTTNLPASLPSTALSP